MDKQNVKNWADFCRSKVILLAAVGLTTFQLLAAAGIVILPGYAQAGVFYAFLIVVLMLTNHSKSPLGQVLDVAVIVLSWMAVYDVFSCNDTLAYGGGLYSSPQQIVAAIQIVLVLYLGLRMMGKTLPLLAIFFLVYALFGNKLPGMFKTSRMTWQRLAPYLLISNEGLFGTALTTCSRLIFIFILFGSVLDMIGAGSFFVDLAFSVAGRVKGGAAQAAIYSSMLMGTISGSGPANVVTTGTITIPLMKKIGFDKDTAGAVEAVASGGGIIMPPVMGAVAFIMSEVTGIPYSQIALAALVPAVLYYLTLSSSVMVYSYKHDVQNGGVEIKSPGETLRQGWYYLIPMVVLIGLMVMGRTVQRCALWAVIAAVAVGLIFKRDRFTGKAILDKLVSTITGLSSIACACMMASIITGCINITGLGLKISGIIEVLSGGSLLGTLILTMIVCLLMGMGLPASAAYVVLSVLVAPIMIQMGVLKIGAHLFILHFGAIATLTPPVALAVFAACTLSGGTLWRTGGQALKLCAAGLLVPFVFVYNPELLLVGSPAMIAFSVVTALLGCIVLSFGTIGWMFRDIGWLQRAVLLACSICLILPRPIILNLIGLAVAVLLMFWNKRQAAHRKEA